MIFGGYFLPVHFLGTRAISKLTRDVIQRKGDNLYFSETVDGYEYYDAGLRLYLQQPCSNWDFLWMRLLGCREFAVRGL